MVRIVTFIRLSVFALCACLAWCCGASADKRVALVIGNSEYGREGRLLNPRNDAPDVAESLKSLGFEVISRVDADKQHFLQALADFSRAVTGADIGLFFYAGHGMQVNGSNYLVPVGAQLQDEVSIRYELVALDEVQQALERSAGVRVLILDACRNNPFAAALTRAMRGANRDVTISRGLARIAQVHGTVVAYSTQANDVAADGNDRNSPFTGALLANLREPGLEIGAMFRKVATRVYETTGGKQVPELSISLLSDVYLNRSETDAQVWGRVRAAADPAGLRDFLARFPDSFYAADARVRLDLLEREARARQLEQERARREKELNDRLAALEVAQKTLAAEASRRANTQPPAAAVQQPGAPAVPAGREPPGQNPPDQKLSALNPENPPGMDQAQLVLAIKTELNRLGCYVEPIDSNGQTPALRKAIADFAARARLAKVPDGPAPQLLEDLKARAGRICAPDCGPREQASDGRCVAKTCAGNEVLDRNGKCVPRNESKPVASTAPRPRREEPPAAGRPHSRGGCFSFNGRQFCE